MADVDTEQTPENIVYETLSPLSPSTCNQLSNPLIDAEPYSVFRNEISLATVRGASPECDGPDFFSLDVAEDDLDASVVSASPPATPAVELKTPAVELKTPAIVAEPKLESGWFQGTKFRSPMLQLHKEIVDFCEFLSPTLEEKVARNKAIDSVFEVIKLIWPHCKVEVFGSFRTGLYLPTSDIDVVILGSGIPTPQLGLSALSRALSQRGMAKKIQVIGKARVPIIKFIEKNSGLAFDISFDVENGPKAAEFIQDEVAKCPPLRPLCLILKIFLQQRELNEVYSGGIGSYGLLIMLMAMLRNVRESQAYPEHNLGVLLVLFFDIYGRKLNTSDVGVSCRGAGTFYLKRSKGFVNNGRPNIISIEDPQAPENDVGKNSFNYFQVRSAFSMAFSTLTNPKTIFGLGPNRSILGTIIRPDPVLIERKGGSNGDVTFRSLLPGAGEPLQQYEEDEFLCNWKLDFEEEPLPRGSGEEPFPRGQSGGGSRNSSGKKRKASFKDQYSKKVKENSEEGGSSSKGKRIRRSKHKGNKVVAS